MREHLLILADETGRILAAGIPEERQGENGPANISFIAAPGQVAAIVPIPEEFPREGVLEEALVRFRLRVDGERPRLVREGHE